MQGIVDVLTMFSSRVPREAIRSCENIGNMFGLHPSIDLLNRYFSSIRNAATEKSVPFSDEVDPHRILSRLETPNYIHSEQNVVHYYELIQRPSGEAR